MFPALLKSYRKAAMAAVIAASLAVCPHAAETQDSLETDVKATFLYNFTKFIEWPAGTPRGSDPFLLCVVSDDPLKRAIDKAIQGESLNGRAFRTVSPRSFEEARSCQVLFVSRTEGDRGARLVAAVRDLPVLTVGDTPRFAETGGDIEFVLENRRVRFDVNLPASERGGLKISSKLLRVARHVHEARR